MTDSLKNKSLQVYFTKPWYLKSWFIGLNYAFWFFIIPGITAITLTIVDIKDNQKKTRKIKELHLDKLAQLEVLESDIEQKLAHNTALDTLAEAEQALSQQNTKLAQVSTQTAAASERLIDVQSELEMQDYGFYGVEFDLETSAEYKARIIMLQEQQKQMVKNDTACVKAGDFRFNGSASEGKKVMRKHTKIALWAFNTHCDNVMKSVTYRNYVVSERKIRRALEIINENETLLSISEAYLALKLQELDATFKFKEKQEYEKEQLREQRAEELEEKKLQREIELARTKIVKDETHINTELSRLQKLLLEQGGTNEKLSYEVSELEKKLTTLQEQSKAIDYRETNAKAGYVYIISNIGSFGESVVKIGVTRRLEPMERINELGDASVPFRFDVHALVFSDKAYELEHKLHQRFKNQRINMVNSRKEFFRLSLADVDTALKEEFKSSAQFVLEQPAREFRESLLKSKQIT